MRNNNSPQRRHRRSQGSFDTWVSMNRRDTKEPVTNPRVRSIMSVEERQNQPRRTNKSQGLAVSRGRGRRRTGPIVID